MTKLKRTRSNLDSQSYAGGASTFFVSRIYSPAEHFRRPRTRKSDDPNPRLPSQRVPARGARISAWPLNRAGEL
jgi:hypothetical protein